MIRVLFLFFAATVLLTASGCKDKQTVGSEPVAANDLLPKQAQPKLQTIKLWIGSEEMIAEVALTAQQQMIGMMFRTNMAENEGMIFVHPESRQAGYWMMNCPLPLSIAYIDDRGVIREIHDLKPHDTNTVASTAADIRFALETRQGWFQRHSIPVGTVIRTERGPLFDTFFRQ